MLPWSRGPRSSSRRKRLARLSQNSRREEFPSRGGTSTSRFHSRSNLRFRPTGGTHSSVLVRATDISYAPWLRATGSWPYPHLRVDERGPLRGGPPRARGVRLRSLEETQED